MEVASRIAIPIGILSAACMRMEIRGTDAVANYLDGGDDNTNFYEAFRLAWFKATTNGLADLRQIVESC